jgi:hypothetical protein
MKIWKGIVWTLAVLALPGVGLALLLALALCGSTRRKLRATGRGA